MVLGEPRTKRRLINVLYQGSIVQHFAYDHPFDPGFLWYCRGYIRWSQYLSGSHERRTSKSFKEGFELLPVICFVVNEVGSLLVWPMERRECR